MSLVDDLQRSIGGTRHQRRQTADTDEGQCRVTQLRVLDASDEASAETLSADLSGRVSARPGIRRHGRNHLAGVHAATVHATAVLTL